MAQQPAHRRRIGTWAAWIGAYAFVLHAMLASIALSSLSPLDIASGTEICASGAQHSPSDDGGQPNPAHIVHCILCVGVHAGGALPPESAFFAVRLASIVRQDLPFSERMSERPQDSPHQARAPPLNT